MTASPWQRPLDPLRADVAVVGGGVIGTATAFWLRALRPALRVAIVEAERLAHGASGRNAGFLLLGTHADYASAVDTYGRDIARRVWRFTQETLEAIREHLDGKAIGLETPGSVLAAGSADEADRLRRAHALLADDGIASDLLGADAANRLLGSQGFHGALRVPDGGALDPARLVCHLARRSGAEIVEGTRIEAVEAGGAGVRLRAAGGGTVEAARVLLATNAWTGRLIPALAALARPVRAQMLATAPVAPHLPAPVYSHDGFFYVRQRCDGRLLLGGARHLHAAAEVGLEDRTTEALQADLERYLVRHLPAAGAPRVERRWSGPMGVSPDGLPALGPVPDVPGAFVAAGFTGHGMGYGVRFGLLTARTLLGEPDPAADLFALDRRSAGGSA